MDDGKARSLGVSNFDQSQLQVLAKTATHKPSLLQSKLSVVHHDDSTIEYCRKNDIVYQSYSPLCGGFNGSSCSLRGGSNVMTVPAVEQIAKTHGKSAAQIGLRWIVQQGLPLTTAVWDLE
jgi:diketogulonate reductase-like aldo/keto reductase